MKNIITSNPCQNCGNTFFITDTDQDFYNKIGETSIAKKPIPHPKLCPDCRQQRRLAFRNERWMYRRKCDFSGKEIISMYPPDSPFKVYDQEIWWSDKWDALSYGRDFDFTRPFFEQFRELQLSVPRLALVNKQSENSEFTNHSGKNKNCFMSAVIFESEDIYYSDWIIGHCRDCFDCSYLLEGCELCYETYYAWGSYKAFFCDFIKRCSDVWFCYDCIACKDCFMCWNLRSKQYCIHNKQYSKQEYEEYMKKIFPLSSEKLNEFKKEYMKAKEFLASHAGVYQLQSIDCLGDLLFNSKNCFYCFDSIRMEDCRYCYDGIDMKDSMDVYHVGWAELMYECHAIINSYNCLFCHFTYDNRNAIYCDCTQNCNNVFGCVGLNRKSYCILNKQYSKEEYEDLVPRIITHMGGENGSLAANAQAERGSDFVSPTKLKNKEYGEFFPIQFSPFAYNQSRANEYYPLTLDQARSKNITWSTYQAPFPEVAKTIPADELPKYIKDISDDIIHSAILCEITQKPFKIIKQEFEFYKKTGLPLPQRHPDQRYLDRMKQRNSRKLWKNHCQKCEIELNTSYDPAKKSAIYCHECYLKMLY